MTCLIKHLSGTFREGAGAGGPSISGEPGLVQAGVLLRCECRCGRGKPEFADGFRCRDTGFPSSSLLAFYAVAREFGFASETRIGTSQSDRY